ncbi:hypothetical protein LV89_02770 [Arcicella aurantiaca]|uniref:Uncharacterized protein n=1 Tax=Arcicella aurantiaca TaxID=591202 RepID=A0A316E413_9BACT|nr:hypothetical protein LV89_02770 [Arcicella aurantiaca]
MKENPKVKRLLSTTIIDLKSAKEDSTQFYFDVTPSINIHFTNKYQ